MSYKIALIVGFAVIAGCAESMPPAELVDAHAAYLRAADGPAAQLNPAQLHVAEEQLARAENSFDKNGDTFKTRDEAYVAERKAELADVQARTMEADKQIGVLTERAQAAQAKDLQVAEAQLAQTRERLAATAAAMADLAAMNSVKNVKQDNRGTVITLSGSVLFPSGKYELLSSAREALTNVANALAKSDPDSKLIVEGFTDSQGSDVYNQALSKNRAEAVRAFLTSHGIAPDRITAEGFGPANPVADNATADGRANNRRVEIIVQPPSGHAMEAPSSITPPMTTPVVH